MRMIGHGKCPKCDNATNEYDFEEAIIGDKFSGPFFNGIAICCRKCKTVLGVSIDPASIAADVARAVTREKSGKRA